MPADSTPPLLPYAEASAFQRTQALHGARRILDAAYSFVSGPQWQQALEHLQLPLQLMANQASLPPEALATLVQYLETQYRTPQPAPALPSLAASAVVLPLEKPRKQTYAIVPSLIEQLARVNYWCRRPISHLVNEALTELLRQYPEAQIPLPAP